MTRREQQLREIEQTLPKSNGIYLQIILGSVNVSILNKSDKYVTVKNHIWHIFIWNDFVIIAFRFKYKDEYEKFKLVLSVIGFVLSVLNLFTNIRWDIIYYNQCCVFYFKLYTTTIRHSIFIIILLNLLFIYIYLFIIIVFYFIFQNLRT